MSGFPLSPARRRALDALCRRIVPAAYEPGDGAVDLAAAVEDRLAAGDPALARQIAALLTLWDSPLTGLLALHPHHFSSLPAEQQDEVLHAWERSRLAPRRTIFQAFRRLALSTYYALPESHAAIGYLGPLHERGAHWGWEGALPGAANDDEPVARVPTMQSDEERVALPPPPRRPIPAGVTLGRDLSDGTTLRAGVCVIGTGAGGAVAAARLAESGHDVVLLEEGGYWTPADFTEREAEMTTRLYADAGARATDDLALSLLQGRSVGGGTTINWMIMLRTPEWVLEEWAAEHGAVGMRPAEMAPVFERIERETHARPVPTDAHSPNNRIILDGAARLGWSARTATINARDCVRAGFCGLGCRYGAKQSAGAVYVPSALAAGARLFCDVRAERLETRGNGADKRVHATVLDRDSGRPRGTVTVEAPVVVLAAGAVGTPAILQRSGLGGGGVGRYLRLHPTSAVLGDYAEPVYAAAGIPLSAVCDEFLRSDDGYGFWIECPPLYPATASAAMPGFGEEHRAEMLRFQRLGSLIVLVRDGAERGASNGDVHVDRRGRTRIRYRLGDADRANLLAGIRAAARLHFAAGAREVSTLHVTRCCMRSEADLDLLERQDHGPNQLGLLSAHVNGTCRMGTDPQTSGCTPDGELHGVPGLYVCDGSLLPTAPGANPQETIMALATIISERIDARIRR